jgi:hypothetical protein
VTVIAIGGASPAAPRARTLRAAGVALVWGLACLPVLSGHGSCAMAEMFGVPCPGCGMTRAILLLGRGDVSGSLHMHPLAVPSLVSSLLFMVATVWATARFGTPVALWKTSLGRAALVTFVGVQAAIFGFWVARMLGGFGGPVLV